jgi:cysteine-rich repeat protein
MTTMGQRVLRGTALSFALAGALALGGCNCGHECGDGNTDNDEECDDGNQQSGDGCSASCTIEAPTTETDCANAVDDDGDGNVDCDDADCNADPACAGMVELDCTNGLDDDGDGDIDCADSNCATDPACVPATETDCTNGVDDDGDGNTDCNDADCNGDPGCAGMVETDCTNGLDDDGDGATDCADTNCATDPACVAGGETDCTNGLDDDGDGATDCADSDCTADPACAAPVCGDGTVDPGEQCDDGNVTAGDGCDAACMFESTGCTAATPTDVTANIDGANVTGTTDAANPSFYRGACDGFGVDGPEAVFTFTLTAAASLRFSTDNAGTNYDTILYLRASDCDSGAAEIGCDNDGGSMFSNLTMYDLPPGVYFLFLDGNNGAAGDYELSIVSVACGDGFVDAPIGEQCDDGNTTAGDGCDASCLLEPVMCPTGAPFTDITGNIDGATVTGTLDPAVDTMDYDGTCGGFGPEHIYQITLTAGQDVRISTDNPGTVANTVIHVRLAICDDQNTEVACDAPGGSNLATVTIVDAAPGTYWVFADSSGAGPFGDYELSLTTPGCGDGFVDGFLNETCDDGNTTSGDGCNAACQIELAMCVPADDTVDLSLGPATLMLDTTADTDDVDAPCLPFGGGGEDHFIQFDVPMDGMVLTVDYDQDPLMMGPSDHVFALVSETPGPVCSWAECTDPGGFTAVGTVTSAPLTAGTYYLVLDAVGGGAGPVNVTLTLM